MRSIKSADFNWQRKINSILQKQKIPNAHSRNFCFAILKLTAQKNQNVCARALRHTHGRGRTNSKRARPRMRIKFFACRLQTRAPHQSAAAHNGFKRPTLRRHKKSGLSSENPQNAELAIKSYLAILTISTRRSCLASGEFFAASTTAPSSPRGMDSICEASAPTPAM